MGELILREIQKKDNAEVAMLIREILVDMGVPKVGTAYEDKALDTMYQEYNKPRSRYFVAEKDNHILGCAGIAPLQNAEEDICELQKMYVSKDSRGQGVAQQLISVCLKVSKTFGFSSCYLETMPYMNAAQGLYKKNGFEFIQERMGDTGHHSCPVFMIKHL